MLGAGVRDREERVRHIGHALPEIGGEASRLFGGAPALVERVELFREPVEKSVDGLFDEARPQGANGFVAGLDGEAADPAFGSHFVVDQAHHVLNDRRTLAGRAERVLQR